MQDILGNGILTCCMVTYERDPDLLQGVLGKAEEDVPVHEDLPRLLH
jgi:hypothetical protein